jgi:hypothetical protein
VKSRKAASSQRLLREHLEMSPHAVLEVWTKLLTDCVQQFCIHLIKPCMKAGEIEFQTHIQKLLFKSTVFLKLGKKRRIEVADLQIPN